MLNMIVGLSGIVEKIEVNFLHLNVNDIIYHINISMFTSEAIKKNDKIKFHISQIIQENSNILYGFINEDEKYIFDNLIKINGVGTKVVMSICSTFSPSELSYILKEKNISLLRKVKGIGTKVANKIFLENENIVSHILYEKDNELFLIKEKAISALESLGFKKKDIEKVMIGLKSKNVNLLIKESLSLLTT